MKRIISILISFAVISMSFVSYGATDAAVNDFDIKVSDAENEIITVSGMIDKTNSVNTVIGVVVIDKETADGTVYTLYDYENHTVGVAYANAEYGTGKFSCNIGMSNYSSGVYQVYVLLNGNVSSKPFHYVSQTDVEDVIDDIKSGEILKDSLFTTVYGINNGLGLDLDSFIDERSKNMFNKRLDQKRNDIDITSVSTKISSVKNIFSDIAAELDYVIQFENANVWMDINALLTNNIYTGIDLNKYNSLSDTNKSYVCKEIRQYSETINEENAESKDNVGALYKAGTKDKLISKIRDAELTIKNERIQSRLNTKQIKFKNDVLSILSENAIPYSRNIMEFNEDEWLNSNPIKSTVIFNEDKTSITVSSTANFIMYYNKDLTPKESTNFSVKYEKLNAWTSLGLKQIGAAASSPTQVNGYFVVIKNDYIELQKTPKPAGANDGIIASVENNGIVNEGQWHNITTSAETVDGGVRCIFKVDGKTVFDYTDKNDPLYDIGCFAFMHNAANGSMSISYPKDK